MAQKRPALPGSTSTVATWAARWPARTLAGVAGRLLGLSSPLWPAKVRMLNVSLGLRPPSRSRISCLEVSSGNPRIEPETSTMKTNSRAGIWAGVTRLGGCIIVKKKFSLGPG